MIGINWIIIGMFIIIGIVIIKVSNLKHKFLILFLIFLALFFYSTFILVSNENEFNFSSSKGIYTAINIYYSWFINEYQDIKSLTGRVIKGDNYKNKTSLENKT